MFVSVRGSNNSRDILVHTENQKGKWKTYAPEDHLTLYPLDFTGRYVYTVNERFQLIHFLQLTGKIHSEIHLGLSDTD